MEYYIGVDAGGTKTDAVLVDETGHIIARDVSAGCNPWDIGEEEALRRMTGVMERLKAKVPAVSAAMVAAAGWNIYPELRAELTRRAAMPHMKIDTDGEIIISGTLGHGDGVGLISGTGSSIFVRVNGVMYSYGGRGYLIDTCGSGFILGQQALRYALRGLDGRCEKTVLYDLIKRDYGKGPEEMIPEIYRKGRAFIASFAHYVFEARKMGDWAANMIFDTAVDDLAAHIRVAAKHFDGAFTVVLNGGLVNNFPEYREALRKASPAQANLVTPFTAPVYGAVVEACWLCGKEPQHEDFGKRFVEDYGRYTVE